MNGTLNAPHVAHDIPGRLRLRLPVGVPVDAVSAAVTAEAGVTSYTWSPRTRSLLVLYDPEHGNRTAIIDAVARAAGVASPPEASTASTPTALTPTEPGAALSLGVREMFGEVDQRVQRATRGLVGLGGLVPVALTAWAVAEVVRGRLAPLAWSSALWYAHGLFRDYQLPAAQD